MKKNAVFIFLFFLTLILSHSVRGSNEIISYTVILSNEIAFSGETELSDTPTALEALKFASEEHSFELVTQETSLGPYIAAITYNGVVYEKEWVYLVEDGKFYCTPAEDFDLSSINVLVWCNGCTDKWEECEPEESWSLCK